MLDIHSHLLPGVDDGSPNADVSCDVLERFAREGVSRVICTPHLRASRAASAPYDRHREILEELRAHASTRGVEVPVLDLGWEIMLDRPGCDLTLPTLTLAGSRALLVEFPRRHLPSRTTDEIARLRVAGAVPVVAHPERYRGVTLDTVREWRSEGAVIQTDAVMLLTTGDRSRMARAMLAHGLVDVLASDNHGDDRSLAAVRRWLQEADAGAQADLLTSVNPARVLADQEPMPVAPVPLGRGLVRRLRQMLFGAS